MFRSPSSETGPLLKRIRRLGSRKHRDSEGAFFAEGIAPVWAAVEHGAEIETVVVAPDLLKSEAARVEIRRWRERGLDIVEVTAGAFAAISHRDNPVGLGAIVRASLAPLDTVRVEPDSTLVALHEIGNPGNLGAIVRTADGVGATAIVLVGDTSDPWHPAAVKAAMGALFAIPLCRVDGFGALWSWAQHQGLTVVTTSARAPLTLWAAEFRWPCLVVFGAEASGLPEDALERGDPAVSIPMSGSATSLNLAVSVGVLLYELERRRRGPS